MSCPVNEAPGVQNRATRARLSCNRALMALTQVSFVCVTCLHISAADKALSWNLGSELEARLYARGLHESRTMFAFDVLFMSEASSRSAPSCYLYSTAYMLNASSSCITSYGHSSLLFGSPESLITKNTAGNLNSVA